MNLSNLYDKDVLLLLHSHVLFHQYISFFLFRNHQVAPDAELEINISIDGIPLHKSGRTSFWPILASIHKMPSVKPMTVAIFCGSKKPDSLEQYLRPLVDELNNLIDKGIAVGNNDTTVKIKVRAIIADSPARSFIKGKTKTKQYKGSIKMQM